jgi:predicted DNA-binding transcriptional regulator AlpA
MTGPAFLTLDQVAERLALRPDTLRRKRAALEADLGFPPPVGWTTRPMLWRADQLDAWLDRQANPPPPPAPAPGAFRPYLVQKAMSA